MAKTFGEYAREREAQLSTEARELGRAFEAAAMLGLVIYEAARPASCVRSISRS